MLTATPMFGKASIWDKRALDPYEKRLRDIVSKQEVKAKGKTSTQANKARGKTRIAIAKGNQVNA